MPSDPKRPNHIGGQMAYDEQNLAVINVSLA